jgi:hypothetical protein
VKEKVERRAINRLSTANSKKRISTPAKIAMVIEVPISNVKTHPSNLNK